MTTLSVSDTHWRSLRYFTLYRLVVIAVLTTMAVIFMGSKTNNALGQKSLLYVLGVYAIFAGLGALFAWKKRPSFSPLLTGQMLADVFFLLLITYLTGGVRSGLGMLLLPYLAAAALISRGRMTLFYAAMASVSLLVSETLRIVATSDNGESIGQAALLSVAYFAVAWLAWRLSAYAQEKELLAEARGVDLAKQEEVNRLILRDMQDGVLVVDQIGRIRHYNPKATELLGMTQALDQLTLADLSFLSAPMEHWTTFGPSTVTLESPLTGRLLNVSLTPVSEQREAGAVIYLRDSAHETRIAQQLKLAALGRLTANIAHEIRNPLSAISHATELLSEDNDAKTSARLLQIMRENCSRLERIVQDVLQLNRRDRRKASFFDLREYIEEFTTQFIHSEKIAPEWLIIEIPQDFSLPFDREHLHQILWNLCRNAARFCLQQAGSITLRAEYQGDDWTIDIANDGPPIAKGLLNQLFEPFFTTRSNGTGLGLYIARELCAANGAELRYIETLDTPLFRIHGKRA